MPKSQIEAAKAYLLQIMGHLNTLEDLKDHMEKRRAELAALGLFKGTITMRGGKYAYLVSPQKQGERQRIYVGADPDAIALAQAKIDRQAEYEELGARLNRLEAACGRLNYQLHDSVLTTNPNKFGGGNWNGTDQLQFMRGDDCVFENGQRQANARGR